MAAEVINVHQAKTHLSRLLDRVRAGEEIVLAKAGKPYAKLVPIEPPPAGPPPVKAKRELGFMKGWVDDAFFDPLPEEELAAWENGPLVAEPIVPDADGR